MRLVVEPDVVRQVVDTDPGNGLLVLPVVEHFQDLGRFRQDGLMAAGAPLDRRNPRYRAAPCVGVAELTIDPRLLDMERVTEVNRLLRRRARLRRFRAGNGCFRLAMQHDARDHADAGGEKGRAGGQQDRRAHA